MAEWIDLLDPTESELRDALGQDIHALALQSLLRPARHDDEPRPRLEGHDHYVFGVFLIPICIRDEDRVFYQELDFVATREKLVTVRKKPERGHPFDSQPVRDSIAREADSSTWSTRSTRRSTSSRTESRPGRRRRSAAGFPS